MWQYTGASARNVRNWSDFDLLLSDLIRKLRATEIYANETGESVQHVTLRVSFFDRN